MLSITFDLETVTPLFLAGADQATAELRSPAFRGALRYWFRAIAGFYQWNDPNQLKDIESMLLGDAGQHGVSNINLRIINHPEKLKCFPVPMTQDRERKQNGSGIGYLLFSMGMQNRKAIGVNIPEKFSIKFFTRPNPKKLEQQKRNLIIAANCFWFAVNLGGFGSRERRGAGSLRVCSPPILEGIEQKEIPQFLFNYQDADTLAIGLKKQINKTRNNILINLGFEASKAPEINQVPELELLSKKTVRIYLIKEPYATWREALDSVGKTYANYRNQEIPNLTDRAILGLPLTGVDMQNRRASPLRIKLVKSLDDYYCLLIRVKAKFPKELQYLKVTSSTFNSIDNLIESFQDVERIFP
jgi:CRISPR-associated protein Cmr1